MNNSNNMFAQMYEVKLDVSLGKYLVHPISTDKREDYAIICNSEFDAKNLCTQIALEMVGSPEKTPLKYRSKGIHSNGHTRLYSLK